jgi:ELWxxDGT repeat protein
MKTQLHNLMLITLICIGVSNFSTAQEILKDLQPGSNVSSGPHQFTNVDGTVYFFTDPSDTRRHALWKTDGTAAGTVMVKDSIISTPVAGRLMIQGVSHDTMYYTVNTNVQSDTTTELWMVKNGSAPVLVTQLVSLNVNQYSNGEPRKYAMAGGKLFFQMYTNHGYELWVSDGTAAGTHEVADLFPGSTSGINNGGTSDLPMIEFNGRIYFQGLTSYTGSKGLYASNGTTIELIKEGPNFNPNFFTVFNNALYFYAESGAGNGLWKTDGTTAGTVNVTTTGFNGDAVIFKGNMYYNVGNKTYKSDGTTMVFNDSMGVIYGKNNDYIFSRVTRYIPTSPYVAYDYSRSDGTVAGTERIVDSLGHSASFVVLNNNMYSVAFGDALWTSDGTAAGVKKLIEGIISSPIIVNNKVVFVRFGTGTGYEPWVYTPAGSSTGILGPQIDNNKLTMYPNPSNGFVQLHVDNLLSDAAIEVLNIRGETVYQATTTKQHSELDLSSLAKGIYFVKINDGKNMYTQKLALQ